MIDAMKRRISCRTYSGRPVEPERMEKLQGFLQSNRETIFGTPVRFQLIDLDELQGGKTGALGTYGVIKGARRFMAGAVDNRPRAMEDYGYCMEKNILQATALGLGTCWLGGTFNRSGFAETMGLKDEELLPAVSPVGHSGDKRSMVERFFRFSAGSDKRKPWQELFFDGDLHTPLQKASAGPYETPLECVRIGPSASNKQPWRITRNAEAFHFYLQRTPGYNAVFGDIKMQNIDMGIAICHFELSAREIGLKGRWQAEAPELREGDWEYIVSWIGG
jgi:hypothetical protein